MSKLEAIKYLEGSLKLLDQRLLPYETVYLDVPNPEAAWQQIKDMVVRGAPAIGVTGALALAGHLISGGRGKQYSSVQACVDDITATMDYLVTSRPTAVNLADSAVKLKAAAADAAAQPGATAESVTAAVVAAAEATLEQDIAANEAIGAAGAAALLSAVAARGHASKRPGGKVTVLTHCNTGSLATAGYGTALGVVRALHEQGKLERCYACETRPYNQGARLTAFELVHDGLPATLLVDSAAAALMAQGKVDAVVVGADRVVANGDTANKIGTYSHAVSAQAHGIPFFVAAPTTTLDANLAVGDDIEIEQRPAEEITHLKGQRVVVEGIDVWNPCFDVTPGRLIEGIITEEGVVPRDTATGNHRVKDFMAARKQALQQQANGAAAAKSSSSVCALDAAGVVAFIAARPELAARVGPAGSESSWAVKEVGDGNINFVYIVQGPSGGVCLKQSLPFVRCVGEGWPLSRDRARIEAEALRLEHKLCPEHVPEVYLYDPFSSIIVMELLTAPYVILRHAIVKGEVYPAVGKHVGHFLAATLFSTSLLAMDTQSFRQMVINFTNPDLCALTEQVIFSDPYADSPINRWTSPQLDEAAAALRGDVDAKAAITVLKRKFCNHADALIHGDLHTGSIMVTPSSSKMIDPEFAYVGPLAFDVAKIIGELIIPFFASDGHEHSQGKGSRAAQRTWLLECIVEVWDTFSSRFLELWTAKVRTDSAAGALSPAALMGSTAANGPAALSATQTAFMQELFADTLGFAGAFIIRRLVGIAHTADMDSIQDADVRAACELRALRFGRHLLVEGAASYPNIRAVASAVAAARQVDGLPAGAEAAPLGTAAVQAACQSG